MSDMPGTEEVGLSEGKESILPFSPDGRILARSLVS